MQVIMQGFSKRLKDLRAEAHMSQQQVAEILNIRQQSYAQYENDVAEPNLETLAKIAKIFEVSTDYLLGLADY